MVMERLGKVAKQDKHMKFNNLMHHITSVLLLEAFIKLNQQVVKEVDNLGWQDLIRVLKPIYEADFLGFINGFRPNRSQHQALGAVYNMVSFKKVSWVMDADLKGFFDNIDHVCLLRQIRHRILDERE
jgi:retron-type reverse transcriptase